MKNKFEHPTRRPIAHAIALAIVFLSTSAQAASTLQLDRATKLAAPDADEEQTASFVSANRIEGSAEDVLTLYGDAEIRRGGSVMRGDKIIYTQENDQVDIEGNAKIFRQGASFSGPSMSYRISAREGSLEDATWEYAPRNLRGCAKNIDFVAGNKTNFKGVFLTTCPVNDDSWHIRLKDLVIDEYDQSATGSNAIFYFKGIPLMGTPWFGFPVNNERRTGFLTPTYAMSTSRGLDLSMPFYWNIAPNYDYTITPRIMSKRGLMVSNELRLKKPNFDAEFNYDIIPEDRITEEMRYGLHASGVYHKDNLNLGINYNRVGDHDFLTDFSGSLRESSEAVLPQDYWLTYNEKYWNTTFRVTKNQTLDIDGIRQTKPYERVPQLTFESYVGDFHGLESKTVIDITAFSHPTKIEAKRAVFEQTVSLPWQGAGWFLIPKAKLLSTHYELEKLKDGYHEKNPGVTLPSFSLDSGLIFERDTHFFGREGYQTLEPRLYYAWVPYRDQSDIPIFDTTIADLNMTTLFEENVFSGFDRTSEANQVSMVISTRYIDNETGLELFQASIGQRQYFKDQRIHYHYDGKDLSDTDYHPNTTRSSVRSDLLGSVAARLSKEVSSSASVQYSSAQSHFSKINWGLTWQPQPMSMLGIYYRYNYSPENLDDHIKQIDFTAQWPLTNRLYGLARYNYSLLTKKPIEMIAGIEYFANCWTLRAVAQRYTTTSNKEETNFFLQLELTGLGSVGTSPLSELKRNIRGYQSRNPIPQSIGLYDYYE